MRQLDYKSVLITVAFHVLLLLLLWFVRLTNPPLQEESGVPVLLGSMGNLDTDYEFTEVAPAPAAAHSSLPVSSVADNSILTQNLEESVSLDSGEKNVEQPKVEVTAPTEEELLAQREHEAAEAARNQMAGLFQNTPQPSQQTETTTQETPAGSLGGNTVVAPKTDGLGAGGTYDLGGRSVGREGLVIPRMENLQAEGRVVVTITVNPAGEVVQTSINRRTNTTNPQLRQAAENAAHTTKFVPTDGVENQSGTITYYFQFKQ